MNRSSKYRFPWLLLLAISMIFVLLKASPCQEKSNIVAYVLPNEGPYYDLKWYGVSSTLKELGYEPQKYSAGGYKNIKSQTDIIENLIQRRVAGIIIHPVSDTAVVPFVERAINNGIIVVAENVDIASNKIHGRVMLENYQNGWELAMGLCILLKGEGEIAALIGPPGQEQAATMWRAAKEYFKKFPKIKVVREEYLQANAQDAMTTVQNIISAHRNLKGLYTWYVQNAIGAALAIKQGNMPPNKIFIVTKDTDSQAEALLRFGYVHNLLIGEPISMGRNSAKLINCIIRGIATEPKVFMRNYMVDLNSIDSIDRAGFVVFPKK